MQSSKLLNAVTIQGRVKALAAQLGVTNYTLKTRPMGDGSDYLSVSDAYYLISEERGIELNRRRTTDEDELLYWAIHPLISSMSWDYELRHRREGEDPRRQAFSKEIELLAKVSLDWAERRTSEHAEVLKHHPMHDF